MNTSVPLILPTLGTRVSTFRRNLIYDGETRSLTRFPLGLSGGLIFSKGIYASVTGNQNVIHFKIGFLIANMNRGYMPHTHTHSKPGADTCYSLAPSPHPLRSHNLLGYCPHPFPQPSVAGAGGLGLTPTSEVF